MRTGYQRHMTILGWLLLAGLSAGAALAAPLTPMPTPAVTPVIAFLANEPPITLNAKSAMAKPVRIGDPAAFEVSLDAASIAGVGDPHYGDKIGPWDVVSVAAGPWRKLANGHYTRTDHLTLTTYEPGDVEFPAIVLKFKTPDGREGEFRSAAFKVKVLPLPAKRGDKPGQLRGLKPPIGMIPLWLVIAAVLLVASAAYLIWRFEHDRRGAWEGGKPAGPPRPAEVVARERLAALRNSAWLAQADMKPYYSELADILRRYLESRYQIPASDRTTAELIRELKSSTLKRTDLVEIRDVLDASDMAKFAKAKPTAQEAETHWQVVSDLVDRTTAAEAAAASATNPGGAA